MCIGDCGGEDDCGDGVCSDLERRYGDCEDDCMAEADGPEPFHLVLLALAAFIVVFAVGVSLIRSKKKVSMDAGEKTVEELQKEKEEIEKMMAIAKAKYHKRELDEESFREIIRDNQKKVIELELKIRTYRP